MEKFDKNINDILKNHEVDFNPDHWAEMEKILDAKGNKKGFAWWIWGIAASVLVASSLLFINSEEDTNNVIVDNEEVINENEVASENQFDASEIAVGYENEESSIEPDEGKFVDQEVNLETSKYLNSSKTNDLNNDLLGVNSIIEEINNNYEGSLGVIEKDRFLLKHLILNPLAFDEFWFNKNASTKDPINQKKTKVGNTIINDQLINQWDYFGSTGRIGGHVFKVNYFTNWTGIVSKLTGGVERYTLSNPIESTVSYEGTFGRRNEIGIGAYAQETKYPIWKDQELALIGSYAFNFDKFGTLRGAVKASYQTKRIQSDNLTYNDMIDPVNGYMFNTDDPAVVPSASNSISTGVGLYYEGSRLFGGINYDHLANIQMNDNNISNTSVQTMMLGYNLPISNKFHLTPRIYRTKVSEIVNYTPSMHLSYRNSAYLGFAYRNLNMPSLYIGTAIFRRLNLNLSIGKLKSTEGQITNSKGFVQGGLSYRFK